MEEEPYGRPYKIERMEPEAVGKIMDQLFPLLPALVVTTREDEEGPPLLTAEEFIAVMDRVRAKAKKAPGPDGIPQSVDHLTSSQSRDTRRGVQPSIEERSIPYLMESGSAGAIAKTWQTSRGPSLVLATLHA